MNNEDLDKLPRERLLSLLRVCLANMRTMDGLWYLGVEDAFGTDAATTIDRDMWEQLARVEARRLKAAFDLGPGIPGLISALGLNPTWMAFADWSLEQPSPSEAVLRITDCYPQKARVESGRGVFPCQEVDQVYFTTFAQGIDPRLKVTCASCPPDSYSQDLWCQWHFRLEGEA